MNTEPIRFENVFGEEAISILEVLRDNYGLRGELSSCKRFLEKTVSSKVYQCKTDNGLVVIKKSFWHSSKDSFEKAYELSEVLRRKGVLLPKVFKDRDGCYVCEAQGNYFVVLEYVDGEHFSSRDVEFSAAGSALGFFHKNGVKLLIESPKESIEIPRLIPVEKPYEESRSLYEQKLRKQLLGTHECAVPEVCEAIRKNIEIIDRTIEFLDHSRINYDSLSRGIVHNDFHVNNGLYKEDGLFAVFLDIDQIGIAPHVWDIGNTLASFYSNLLLSGKENEFEKKALLFLREHNKVFPLSKEEYLLCLAATQRWDVMRILRSLRRHHYENNRLSGLLPKIKDRLIPRLEIMPRVFSFLTEKWLNDNIYTY